MLVGLSEILDKLLGHHNFSFECLVFLLFGSFLAHLSSLFDAAGFGFEPKTLVFLTLRFVFRLLASLFFLEGLALLSQLLLLFEFLRLFEEPSPLNLILLLQKSLLSFFLFSGELSFLFLHRLALDSLPLEPFLGLAGLSLLALFFLLGDGGELGFLLGFGFGEASFLSFDAFTLF